MYIQAHDIQAGEIAEGLPADGWGDDLQGMQYRV
jgi:hypothetical protein